VVQNLFDEDEARSFVDRYAEAHGIDLALRVYTSRLIGRDPGLVLHGGGNTSVKTIARDAATGAEIEVLRVKGSGSDLAAVEPRDLPAVRLAPLRGLRGLPRLGDEEMVHQVRSRLLDASAPTPSVETLLHAFLPQKFVDHTHADAILVLTNQPDGEARIRDALGPAVAVLPWIMPGHPLAEAVAAACERAGPACEGVVLLHHGIFTFGADARQSYGRMIEFCDRAERAARRAAAARVPVPAQPGPAAVGLAEVLPVVRGAFALPVDGEPPQRFVADARTAADLRAFSLRPDAAALCASGPLTPDHVLRTKGSYLFLRAAEAADPDAARAAVARFASGYRAYFEACRGRVAGRPAMLDPHPRVAVVEGLGLCGFGADTAAARIAADIAEHTLRAKVQGEAIGRYQGLPPADLFEMEYWSLEQAKLGKRVAPALGGQIALVTGAGGAIGCGIAGELLAAGAQVMLADLDPGRLDRVVERLRAVHGALRLARVEVDVTDAGAVDAAFAACVERFGGVDIVVPNAGIAHVSTLAAMDPERFRRVVDVNLTGTMLCLRAAARIFERQRTGGAVVLQGSKNVPAPGAGFGAYSASKAGATQLARVAALEFAALGVTVNTVHADAVFGDEEVPSGLWDEVGPERMRARGLDPEGLRAFYRDRSLLKRAVRPEDVGRAVVALVGMTRTTGAVLPVDAGVAEAFPR
jgi:rhamnose utilization protein RhaD (predicted bifunctional aldolase and dehydrogenase)/NAD(P)-dependent dehydrogenase (short-subunit alcohol dehydrogenase family)